MFYRQPNHLRNIIEGGVHCTSRAGPVQLQCGSSIILITIKSEQNRCNSRILFRNKLKHSSRSRATPQSIGFRKSSITVLSVGGPLSMPTECRWNRQAGLNQENDMPGRHVLCLWQAHREQSTGKCLQSTRVRDLCCVSPGFLPTQTQLTNNNIEERVNVEEDTLEVTKWKTLHLSAMRNRQSFLPESEN